jgi:mono/diheme cytochrome c family protein
MNSAASTERSGKLTRDSRPATILHQFARTLTAVLLIAMPIGCAQTPFPATTAAALPTVCTQTLSADRLLELANFIWAGCPQLLKWPHDAAIRMSGPSPLGTRSVHGYVLNYYAPSVYAWLKAGRPDGGIPDGAVILKQMYVDNKGKVGDVSGWTMMVKKKSASYDGWFWGWADPQKPKPSPTDTGIGGQFYDPNCVGCHASASTRELTFSALVNIAPAFGGTTMPTASGLTDGSVHARAAVAGATNTTLTSVPSLPMAKLTAPPKIPNNIPPQDKSIVIVGPQGPAGFVTSDVCSGCHDASNLALAVQANMTWPQNVPPKDFPNTPLSNISPFGEWGASMMGLAGRDPVFQAQRESETKLYPSVAAVIDDACYNCHGVMGKRQHALDKPGSLFTHPDFLASSGPNASYGALARDGISCLACHRMTPDGLGTPASFTGNFKITDAKTVFGPYKDFVKYPMENAVGITPKHGDALTDPAMCGSCHVVQTAILDAKKTYDRKTFAAAPKSHEQTTYLEWLNSAYQTKAPRQPGATPQTCQQCHMPRTMQGKPITTRIANIEDNTYVDANNKPFPNTAPAADITMAERSEFSRHTLVGANVFVLEMFRQFAGPLGLTQGDRNYDTKTFQFVPRLDLAIAETVAQVQKDTATIAIRAQRKSAYGLEVDSPRVMPPVMCCGHPAAVPTRACWWTTAANRWPPNSARPRGSRTGAPSPRATACRFTKSAPRISPAC